MFQESDFELEPETQIIFSRFTEGKPEEALKLADSLLSRDNTNAVAWYLKGIIYRHAGNVSEALTSLNAALKAKPDFRKACEDLARLLLQNGQVDLAFQMYMHLLRIHIVNESQADQTAVSRADAGCR